MKTDIDKLKDHVIVCGFGRIGVMLAKALSAGAADFVVLERNEARLNEARELGYLCLQGDATDEAALHRRRRRARPHAGDGAARRRANVFITLERAQPQSRLQIIARGEVPSTESKLLQAGADKVVLPTHIGAERIAEMILFENRPLHPRLGADARLREGAARSSAGAGSGHGRQKSPRPA